MRKNAGPRHDSPCKGPVIWLLSFLLLSAPLHGQAHQAPDGKYSPKYSMREFHLLARRFLEAVRPEAGQVVVAFGLTTPDYMELLVERVGPQGRVIAVFRTEADYRYAREQWRAQSDRVEVVFAADGDAHLDPGIADLIFAVDLYGFFLREDDVYRQAHAALEEGGRLVQVRSLLRTRQEQSRRYPNANGPLQGRAKSLELNRQRLQVTRFGFRYVEEIPIFRTRSVRVFERSGAP
jgi:hypothetical protein